MTWINQFVELLYPLDNSKQDIKEAYLLKRQHLPASIFKYRAFNDLSLDNLKSDTVWLATVSELNDPYDCHHWVDYPTMLALLLKAGELDELLQSLLLPEHFLDESKLIKTAEDPLSVLMDLLFRNKSLDEVEKIKEDFTRGIVLSFIEMSAAGSQGLKLGFKLCSFSARVDSPLMWAHYANDHKGFCIEYDVKSASHMPDTSELLCPVIYQDEPFNATSLMMTSGKKTFNRLAINMAGLVKSKDWSYEEEWRIIFTNETLKASQPFRMPTPKTVYLGSHIHPDHQTDIIKICESKSISVKKMKHLDNAFKMQSVSV